MIIQLIFLAILLTVLFCVVTVGEAFLLSALNYKYKQHSLIYKYIISKIYRQSKD